MESINIAELGEHIVSKMPKEKRPLSSDDSDSGPEDRAPLPKSQKKSLHKVLPKLGKNSSFKILFRNQPKYLISGSSSQAQVFWWCKQWRWWCL